jgi:quercetin 2,3-dioxygenase
MNLVYHPADSRGKADFGWLRSRHTFSFGSYYDPTRMHFGVLRVLNDDIVAPGHGFPTHAHDNMEIVSIPLAGDLEHRDSMGNAAVIREGDIQVMSAGTGVQHSEYNHDKDREVRFLQIWIISRERQVTPRYDQIALRELLLPGQFNQILSPDPQDQGVWIHQDAWFQLGDFQAGQEALYTRQKPENGVYIFMIEGKATINGQPMAPRDGLGLTSPGDIAIRMDSDARILLMEVPLIQAKE